MDIGFCLRLVFLKLYHILVKQFTGRCGDAMIILLTVLVYSVVNFLMLTGISHLFYIERSLIRQLFALLISVIHILLYFYANNTYINSFPVYCFSLLLTSVISFGFKKDRILAVTIYVLIYLAFAGIGYNIKNSIYLFLGTLGILLLSFTKSLKRGEEYVCVKIWYNDKDYTLKALLDTGNLLRDPITGRPVLVVGADVAQNMTGLSVQQLRNPLESIQKLPGFCLIPYKTIGQSGMFILGIYIKRLKIGKWKGSGVIGLSPEILSHNDSYQALTGGYI